jgi:RNA polymerase sigma-70 factor (ECF subfamily)
VNDADAPASDVSEAPSEDTAVSVPADDRGLLAGFCRHRDPEVFAVLLDRHQADLLRTADALLGDGHAAQDAVQEAFLRLGRDADEVLRRWPQGSTSLGGWLATVVRNWCIDQLRRKRMFAMTHEEPKDQAPAPAVEVATADTGEALWHAVADLPDLERAAVVLRYRDELSYQDIADRLGKSATHVGVLLHQALGRLRTSPVLRQEVLS